MHYDIKYRIMFKAGTDFFFQRTSSAQQRTMAKQLHIIPSLYGRQSQKSHCKQAKQHSTCLLETQPASAQINYVDKHQSKGIYQNFIYTHTGLPGIKHRLTQNKAKRLLYSSRSIQNTNLVRCFIPANPTFGREKKDDLEMYIKFKTRWC